MIKATRTSLPARLNGSAPAQTNDPQKGGPSIYGNAPPSLWDRAKPYVVPVAVLAFGGFGAYLLYRFVFKRKKRN